MIRQFCPLEGGQSGRRLPDKNEMALEPTLRLAHIEVRNGLGRPGPRSNAPAGGHGSAPGPPACNPPARIPPRCILVHPPLLCLHFRLVRAAIAARETRVAAGWEAATPQVLIAGREWVGALRLREKCTHSPH